MKLLVLIPCCGEKTKNGTEDYHKLSRNSIISYLSKECSERLLKLRKQVALAFQEAPGPDLGFEAGDIQIKFLEAYKRYSGNLYSKISNDSWRKLERNSQLSLIIVSALYGLLSYNEPVRCYNRSMKDHIHGKSLKNWWKTHFLTDILLDYIKRNQVEEVHDFLSRDYRDTLSNLSFRCKSIDVLHVAHNYPGLGSGSDFHRGIDINSIIQKFPSEAAEKSQKS